MRNSENFLFCLAINRQVKIINFGASQISYAAVWLIGRMKWEDVNPRGDQKKEILGMMATMAGSCEEAFF